MVYDGDDSDDYVCYDDNDPNNDGHGTYDDAVAGWLAPATV